jgi:hypothetical protein
MRLFSFVLEHFIDDVPVFEDFEDFLVYMTKLDGKLLDRCDRIVRVGIEYWQKIARKHYSIQLRAARTACAMYTRN